MPLKRKSSTKKGKARKGSKSAKARKCSSKAHPGKPIRVYSRTSTWCRKKPSKGKSASASASSYDGYRAPKKPVHGLCPRGSTKYSVGSKKFCRKKARLGGVRRRAVTSYDGYRRRRRTHGSSSSARRRGTSGLASMYARRTEGTVGAVAPSMYDMARRRAQMYDMARRRAKLYDGLNYARREVASPSLYEIARRAAARRDAWARYDLAQRARRRAATAGSMRRRSHRRHW
jgi:hypothetical protein